MDTTAKKWNLPKLLVELLCILLALVFLVPFYFLLANSLKTYGAILSDSAALPAALQWSNYREAWNATGFPHAFVNSLVVTVVSNLLLAFLCSMCAYKMVRNNSLYNRILYVALVAAMVIPFQAIMIPLVQVVSGLGFMNSTAGLILAYLGFGAPMTVFLFHGFVKSVPIDLEEASKVDGTSPYGTFFRIVLPLMQPIIVTVIILNTLWIWNDYLMPSLILQDPALRTIPIAVYTFFGQYTKQWDLALPGLVLGITPVVIFFLAMQKYIIEGIAQGSVKG
ncbi:carbohydrate ABC transporter permease [Paenibacillus tepidiphilus]|uniref:carbohydrate ABC transporter permease n=1 Tax=Paenibacillus tepidiphilus TaxID=2608683 RepID=UPI001238E8D1|nr:carbohydrate ABC transporter permease [Paenibacillus tepidiphilus]